MKLTKVKLNDICNLITCGVAKRPNYVESGIPFLSARNVKKQKIIWNNFKFISHKTHEELTKYNKPLKGDILYTRVGSYGEAAIVDDDREFSLFVSLTLIKPKHDIVNNKFLVYFLNSPMGKLLAKKNINSSGVGNLNVGKVRNFEIFLPSLEKQQRIVAKLDAAFAEIDKTISLTKQKKIEEKNIKLSILKSIFSINKSQKTIGKIATVIAGQSPEGKYYNKTAKGIPFYQGKKEFGDYELKKPNVWTTKTTKVSLKGDVLLSVRAPVGETNINNEKICIGRGLAAIRANKECNSEFIYYFLNSIKDKIVGNTGAVFNSINKKQIEDIIIPAPSSDEQTQIVNKIKSIFSLMNEINLLTKQKLDNLNILKSSILKQELRNKAA